MGGLALWVFLYDKIKEEFTFYFDVRSTSFFFIYFGSEGFSLTFDLKIITDLARFNF
jgi:hypothetical protein